jgi:hypothetical protein
VSSACAACNGPLTGRAWCISCQAVTIRPRVARRNLISESRRLHAISDALDLRTVDGETVRVLPVGLVCSARLGAVETRW